MRAIVVDDEPIMLRKFVRISANIEDLNIVGQFESASRALDFAAKNSFEVAFLDVAMPIVNGITLAQKLRSIMPDVIIVFISAYDGYLWDFNQIGGDYYIIKPYNLQTIEMAMEKLRLLSQRQKKDIYIQTFGRFLIFKNNNPLNLTGKAKEILALVTMQRGKEISNEEIYSTIWEGRAYGNIEMTVYYNALRRLKQILKKENLENLLISTKRGQLINTSLFDCDYYAWKDKKAEIKERFEGELLSEYSWGEVYLAQMEMNK